MAIIHRATLAPSKLDLMTAWLPDVPRLAEHVGADLRQIGSYRFDDPAGETGVEVHLVTSASGVVLQVPLTYRNDPVDAAADAFVGTMEHSVLGTRYVYDGTADPVCVEALARAVVTAGTQAAEMVEMPDGPVERPPTVAVLGSGAAGVALPTIESVSSVEVGSDVYVDAGAFTLVILGTVDAEAPTDGTPHLAGTWDTGPDAALLATITG